MNRSTIIETMARAIVRAKGAEVCASDDEWPLAVAHHRAMTAKHGAAYTNGRSLYTDAFNFAESALAAYEAHLEASGMAVVPREPSDERLNAICHAINSRVWKPGPWIDIARHVYAAALPPRSE